MAVVAHTASKPVGKRHLMRNTTEIGLDRWQSLDETAWRLIVGKLKGKSASRTLKVPSRISERPFPLRRRISCVAALRVAV